MTDAAYVWGTGRRKCAVAQVRLYAGEGGILVNGKPHTELFPRLEHRRMIEGPLTVNLRRIQVNGWNGEPPGNAEL